MAGAATVQDVEQDWGCFGFSFLKFLSFPQELASSGSSCHLLIEAVGDESSVGRRFHLIRASHTQALRLDRDLQSVQLLGQPVFCLRYLVIWPFSKFL